MSSLHNLNNTTYVFAYYWCVEIKRFIDVVGVMQCTLTPVSPWNDASAAVMKQWLHGVTCFVHCCYTIIEIGPSRT